jgi:predicted enzyme related to lactoylglutathione lyase
MKTSTFLGLRTTIYKVSDISAAKKWYAKIFGVEPYFDEPFYVGFNVAGYELGLQPEEKPNPAKEGGVVSYWGVENVDEIFKLLISTGATSFEKPAEVGGGIIVATVKDPWNNLVGIICNPHFSLA